MKIALNGFGTVGKAFAQILQEKAQTLRQDYHLDIQIVAIHTRTRGTLYNPNGLDIKTVLTRNDYHDLPDATQEAFLSLITHDEIDAVVDVTPTDLQTGQPGLDVCRQALSAGKHAVLASKGALAVAFQELQSKAEQTRSHLLYEATVMAGTPAIRLAKQALAGCAITEARGILNGTTNYILTQMESGMTYADALKQAQQLGYAEPDPSGDVEGWDAAAKILILSAAIFGLELTLSDLDVTGITQITPEDIAAAQAAGERYKLIASITCDGGSVRPMRLPLTDPLANVNGATNAITYRTDLMGDITLIGAGAGPRQTGFALLSDLIDIHRRG
ncbi:MAG: homoserine dehydrogenase [Chloroflexi bacterium]|nr:MAG: homoserine dehydrogenase [Chloroflexota bacterium]